MLRRARWRAAVVCEVKNENKKGKPKPVSPFSQLFFLFSFDDEDLMRSSSARNSAVSSSMVFGGRWGKGITSDIGRTSLGYTSAPYFLLPRNCCNSAATGFFRLIRNSCHNCFGFSFAVAAGFSFRGGLSLVFPKRKAPDGSEAPQSADNKITLNSFAASGG
jgi:hypothetical protein